MIVSKFRYLVSPMASMVGVFVEIVQPKVPPSHYPAKPLLLTNYINRVNTRKSNWFRKIITNKSDYFVNQWHSSLRGLPSIPFLPTYEPKINRKPAACILPIDLPSLRFILRLRIHLNV